VYAKYGDETYWDEHRIARKDRPVTSDPDKKVIQMVEKSLLGERWQTVRDAIIGLPDPKCDDASQYSNHEFRNNARTYVGHSGSILDEPSKTIKAGVHGVPGGENTIIFDDGSLRYYTVRESARVQTFPDDYVFHGSWTECMRQIGNAVPVKLANVIGESVIKQLERMETSDAKGRKACLESGS